MTLLRVGSERAYVHNWYLVEHHTTSPFDYGLVDIGQNFVLTMVADWTTVPALAVGHRGRESLRSDSSCWMTVPQPPSGYLHWVRYLQAQRTERTDPWRLNLQG